MTAAEYQQALLALLPSGLPWPRAVGSVLGRLLGAWADTLARLDGRAQAFLLEIDPRTTTELIDEWERAYGLPDPCTGALEGLDARRAALVQKIIALGRQTPAFYLEIAAALGLEVTLTEGSPVHDVAQTVAAPLYSTAWAYRWTLHIGGDVNVQHWRVDGRVDQPLGSWRPNAGYECLFRRLKPAHTILVFRYGS